MKCNVNVENIGYKLPNLSSITSFFHKYVMVNLFSINKYYNNTNDALV